MMIIPGKETTEFKQINLWVKICAYFTVTQSIFVAWTLYHNLYGQKDLTYPCGLSVMGNVLLLIYIGWVATEYLKDRTSYKITCHEKGIKSSSTESDQKKMG